MNTTTDRHSRSYHQRMLDSAYNSSRMADQALAALIDTQSKNHALRSNCYWTDMVDKAKSLADEMAADIDDRIEAAAADGFGPEDFS